MFFQIKKEKIREMGLIQMLFQVIKLMSISHGDRSVDLPSLNVEHNYPHLLSELVMKL